MIKIKVKELAKFILTIVISIGLLPGLSGQKEVDIVGGVGFPELINVGARFYLDQVAFGASVGTSPFGDRGIIAVSGDVFVNFGTISEVRQRGNLFFRMGGTYIHEKTKTSVLDLVFLCTRIGREISFSPNSGIQVGLGIGAVLHVNEKINNPKPVDGWYREWYEDTRVIPCFDITFFFKV